MNTLINALENKNVTTYTLNGAPSNLTSGSRLLDFFGQAGSMRTRSEDEILTSFKDAFNEDQLIATKTLFWARDIRGGAGERRTFRIILSWLANNHPNIVRKNLENISEYGRYDDLMTLLGTSVEDDVISFIQKKVIEDLNTDRPSLLAKWLASPNTSSKETRKNAKKISSGLKLTSEQYRKVLSKLRAKIKIVESAMCAKEWDSINYDQVPSRAAMIYRKAFRKNDPTRYEEYMKAVEKGEKTIKATTLFPYDIVRAVSPYTHIDDNEVRTLDAQWKALPNYFEGSPYQNWLAVCDVSGSMMCNNNLPMYTSVGLGIYCAERAKGAFHNKYITYSATPRLVTVTGNNIKEKVNHTMREGVGYNTNLQAVFDLILETGVNNMVPQSDMPDTLVILTDYQFDHPQHGATGTNFDVIKSKYSYHGYEMPRLVFWNVNVINPDSPITVTDDGVVLVSGQSASTFKSLMQGKEVNALSLFLDTVCSDRYTAVTV